MKRLEAALSAVVSLLLFAACGGLQPSVGSPGAARQVPAVTTDALLYIADAATNEVRVYSWPALNHVGTLTGFNTPGGECVDTSGNVWIVNINGSTLVRYAHGGTQPFKKLHDRGLFPHACSVNPKNGDVAVANERPKVGDGPGDVTIYKDAVDVPERFVNPAMPRVSFLAYDSDGNLFLDGKDSAGAFQMAKFDGKTFTPITISGASIKEPGGVFTDGRALSVSDLRAQGAEVYQITDTGTVTGTTNTTAGACAQYFITGSAKKHELICPNFRGPSVDVYDYPAGGNPIEHLKAGLEFPFGAVISR